MTDLNENADADDQDFEDEEGTGYDFAELLELVTRERDVILAIPDDQIKALKDGLSVKKAKENAKQKNAGLVPSKDALAFLVYKTDSQKNTAISSVRIKLGPRTNITVLSVEIPDDRI